MNNAQETRSLCNSLILVACCFWAAISTTLRADFISFRTEILPVLTKVGCNSGACHGAATGQGGLKLSLLGYDPDEDFNSIARELQGRRVDLTKPENSLILRKNSGDTEHEGGRRLRKSSDDYKTLLAWIGSGAPRGSRTFAVKSIQVLPKVIESDSSRTNGLIRVMAHYIDGSKRDVTTHALFNSNDEAVATVNNLGEVSMLTSGLTSIMIRYSGHVDSVRVVNPFRSASPKFTTRSKSASLVDQHVANELVTFRMPHSPRSKDSEFLRRVTLDLTGRLPDADRAKIILRSKLTEKHRFALIDSMLGSEEFVDYWTMHLADWLLVSGRSSNALSYHRWIRKQVADNTPINSIVKSVLLPVDESNPRESTDFYSLASDPRDLAEHVSRIFLGTQLACARCHAHPSDQWTQDNYYQFAAFFSGIERSESRVRWNTNKFLNHPKTGNFVIPKTLKESTSQKTSTPVPGDQDSRERLVEWITESSNLMFAKSFVNRVWKLIMGRGLVEPVDDLRPTNPASHPDLLDALAIDFIRTGYDLRQLIRELVTSETYQLSSATTLHNRADTQFYSHAYTKPLPAQVFLDVICQVTGMNEAFENQPIGRRAVQLATPSIESMSLDVLGRCQRKSNCDTSSTGGGGLALALNLLNGHTINSKLDGPLLESLLKLKNAEIVTSLYLRCFTREPTSIEHREWTHYLRTSKNRRESIQDLMWALLNSREFGVNH